MTESAIEWDRAFDVDDPKGVDGAARAIRQWSGSLELSRPPRDALLYEQDGTLYGACLAESMTIRHNHAELRVRRGDMIVVPQDFAIDAGPVVDLLGIVAIGHKPDHFRERFLQVFGFEHFRAIPGDDFPGPSMDLIHPDDARHRVTYAIRVVRGSEPAIPIAVNTPCLLIGLDGEVYVRGIDEAGKIETPGEAIRPGLAIVTSPGRAFSVTGDGRFGILRLASDLEHERVVATRRARPGPVRPNIMGLNRGRLTQLERSGRTQPPDRLMPVPPGLRATPLIERKVSMVDRVAGAVADRLVV